LLDFMLRAADCCVDLVLNFFDDASSVKFAFDDFISLQEPLEFARQLVILSRDQVHVFVEGFDFILHCVRSVDQPVVVLPDLLEVVLKRFEFTDPCLHFDF